MPLSLVICFHSSRKSNLEQMIRFLDRSHEIILVCQDECENVYDIPVVNMNLNTYNQAKISNFAVKRATNPVVALLDSDRIFPENYFGSILSSIKEGQFVSTYRLYQLTKDHTDEEIIEGKLEKVADFKSPKNRPLRKNLFAGSSVFFKKDWLALGGMDETYEMYGYSDTDMTKKVMTNNYEIIWRNDMELHLFHEPTVYFEGNVIKDLPQLSSACNAIRYYRKWKEPTPKVVRNFIEYCRVKFKSLKKIKNFEILFEEKLFL